MRKLVKDFTYKDLCDYGNNRACDGRWGAELAIRFMEFYHSIPKYIFKKKKDVYVKTHIHELFNLKDYPNMVIDIDTGTIICEKKGRDFCL